ncbi:MAG: LysR family transcriptional regulator [Herbaspirillum sp.]|jgi:DNA-binding transcriptional LysR family regulator|nr:LysR family transcriptional regulator [Herbaspirillum sp.]
MDYYSAVRAFMHAAELQSFSKAAEEMAVKTSTVSRYVSDLEKDLGIALFNRSTRGLALTEGGRVFREGATVALQALEQARHAATSLNETPKGVLRVTMPSSFGRRHIVPHLPEFMRLYPDIDIDAVMNDETLNVIESGIDVAIRIGALPDSLLTGRRLAPQRRIACASPDYVARKGMPAKPAELAEHESLRFSLVPDDKWFFTRTNANGTVAEQAIVDLQGRFRGDDSETMLALALAGCGIALLPTWIIGPALREGRLIRALPDWEAHPRRQQPSIWVLYPPKKTVSSKVRAFVDFYSTIIAESPYWDAELPKL